MEILQKICIYNEEQILDIVMKVEELLDEKIHSSSSQAVKDFISRLSSYRGRLIAAEAQMRRIFLDKVEVALETEVMKGKTKEIREKQLDIFVKEEKANYVLFKNYREELAQKITNCSSVLKSIDLYRSM